MTSPTEISGGSYPITFYIASDFDLVHYTTNHPLFIFCPSCVQIRLGIVFQNILLNYFTEILCLIFLGTFQKICKPGWTTYKLNNGRCYRLYDTPKIWNDAKMACNYAGGELLSIGGRYSMLNNLYILYFKQFMYYRS
jgi:hypothetical protein